VITPLSGPAAQPPFDLYRPTVTASLPAILDGAPATLRHPLLRAPFEISAASVAGFRDALGTLGFTEIHTPKIVESATESGANVFGIDYFGKPAYLAQSPQFYKQAMVGVFERVFETGPDRRAAAAPARGLPGRARRARRRPPAIRRLPAGIRARDAAARRVRNRA
jgi:nondiscriminating aspartyl-tRNA synthetase